MYTTSVLSAAEKTAAEKTDLRWFDMSHKTASLSQNLEDFVQVVLRQQIQPL
jgi:hypothetical protein